LKQVLQAFPVAHQMAAEGWSITACYSRFPHKYQQYQVFHSDNYCFFADSSLNYWIIFSAAALKQWSSASTMMEFGINSQQPSNNII